MKGINLKKPLVEYAVKAKLESGEIVTLEKDCDCVIHDGPHWVYMDAFDRRLAKDNKDVSMELNRLDGKKRMFKRYGIVELIPPFKYDDPRWSYFTYRQTTTERTEEQRKYDEWLEGYRKDFEDRCRNGLK
jgi:hypothetical protein